ncbi:hypothetical protein D7192_31940 [Burkholderia cepacia]|nr:hypothetical protein [Burkholderia cepacia]MBB0020487.1 hypothetical protein [Burkholderia cepacia]MBB0073123.1 hypothetical protein [Burkholderia cepacia]MBB0088005.1 hypothetical protein [Burkholderia cepacia]MBB0145081.1 hypothetical protein [Burkholderia cepacia]
MEVRADAIRLTVRRDCLESIVAEPVKEQHLAECLFGLVFLSVVQCRLKLPICDHFVIVAFAREISVDGFQCCHPLIQSGTFTHNCEVDVVTCD